MCLLLSVGQECSFKRESDTQTFLDGDVLLNGR